MCLVDEVTLGAPLAVEGRARHALGARSLALPLRSGGLALGTPSSEARPELTLDGSGTVRVDAAIGGELEPVAAAACWRAWSVATLAYLAGLGARALELAVEHARTREQFGAPLAALPAVQSRLADAALGVDALTLLAWSSSTDDRSLLAPELLWAGAACCEVTASAHQVHGAIGFALETGLHRSYRRARGMHAWATAVCAATR
jgi:alkylation response protein AidB-like acyl-CoA dehydrogenase